MIFETFAELIGFGKQELFYQEQTATELHKVSVVHYPHFLQSELTGSKENEGPNTKQFF